MIEQETAKALKQVIQFLESNRDTGSLYLDVKDGRILGWRFLEKRVRNRRLDRPGKYALQ